MQLGSLSGKIISPCCVILMVIPACSQMPQRSQGSQVWQPGKSLWLLILLQFQLLLSPLGQSFWHGCIHHLHKLLKISPCFHIHFIKSLALHASEVAGPSLLGKYCQNPFWAHFLSSCSNICNYKSNSL